MYRRDIGWKSDGKGGYSQHRFYLGRDRDDALLRSLQLERVWGGVERRWERYRRMEREREQIRAANAADPMRKYDHVSHGYYPADDHTSALAASDRPVWDGTTLAVAQAVARGEAVVRLVHDAVRGADWHPDLYASQLADWLRDLRLDFPHVRIEVAEAVERQAEIVEATRVQEARKVLEIVVPRAGQTLHQALDAYAAWIRQTYLAPGGDGRVSQHGVTMQTYVGLLKEHHADVPLDLFGLAELDAMLNYWRHRLQGKRGRQVAPDTARDMIKRVRHFTKWLHRFPGFRWRLPEDWEDAPVRVSLTHAEKSKKLNPAQVETYTLDELCTLYEYATPWERALMLLALNCGFGRGEIESLSMEEIHIRTRHGHYDSTGSWIKRLRYKSTVYGEWSLWDETVLAVEWLLARRGQTDQRVLLLTETGRPLSEPTAGNNRNNKLPNAWDKLLARIRKDHGSFRKLSFNKLRKTAGNLVRQFADGETAHVFLSHGTPCKADDLLDFYTNKNFAKVFLALDAVRLHLGPMFARVAVPFPAPDAKEERPALSRGTINKIRRMKQQGFKVAKIAEDVGVSEGTVRRHMRKV